MKKRECWWHVEYQKKLYAECDCGEHVWRQYNKNWAKDGSRTVAIFDPDSFEILSAWATRIGGGGKGYVFSSKSGLIHRQIANAERGDVVDHINRDSLDNRICNLHVGTQADNMSNKRKYRKKEGPKPSPIGRFDEAI